METDKEVLNANKDGLNEGITSLKNAMSRGSRTMSQVQNDSRDIAEPSEELSFKKSKELDEKQKMNDLSVSGVVEEKKVNQKEGKFSGETNKEELNESANSVNKEEQSGNVVNRKKIIDDESDEDLERGVPIDGSTKQKKSPEVEKNDAVGFSERVGRGAHVKIDHIVGKQDRAFLSNGQQVVVLNIDKEKWLQRKPDAAGNLKISLYNPLVKDKNDNFNNSIIKIPYHKVATLPVDENGRIKLLVSEQNPGQKSKLDVHVDTESRRVKIAEKNGMLLGEKTNLLKEKILDKPLQHGFYGYEMKVTGRDLVNQMPEEKKAAVEKMCVNEVKLMLNDPDNQSKYSRYEMKYAEKYAEKFKSGMKVSVPGEDKDGKFIEKKIEFVNLDKDDKNNIYVRFKDSEGKIYDQNYEKFARSTLVDKKDEVLIKNDVLKEICKDINLKPSLAQHENLDKEKVMDTQITPDVKYRDYVDKMSMGDQGDVNKKSAPELKGEVDSKRSVLEKNEHQLKGPGEIKQDGSITSQTASEKLTKAIYNNDEKMVTKLLNTGDKIVGKEHLRLMKEMRQSNMPLSVKIENDVKMNVKAPKVGHSV